MIEKCQHNALTAILRRHKREKTGNNIIQISLCQLSGRTVLEDIMKHRLFAQTGGITMSLISYKSRLMQVCCIGNLNTMRNFAFDNTMFQKDKNPCKLSNEKKYSLLLMFTVVAFLNNSVCLKTEQKYLCVYLIWNWVLDWTIIHDGGFKSCAGGWAKSGSCLPNISKCHCLPHPTMSQRQARNVSIEFQKIPLAVLMLRDILWLGRLWGTYFQVYAFLCVRTHVHMCVLRWRGCGKAISPSEKILCRLLNSITISISVCFIFH